MEIFFVNKNEFFYLLKLRQIYDTIIKKEGVMGVPIFLYNESKKPNSAYRMEIYNGMTREFAKRRIKYFFISSPEELKEYLKKYNESNSSLVLFPTSEKMRRHMFDIFSEINIYKIVFAKQDVHTVTSDFSSVTCNFQEDMKLAVAHLKERGCKKIALFNANSNGNHDKARIESYIQHIYHDPLIFYADKTIYHVLLKLLDCEEQIDAIICNNDYTAFHLMLFLSTINKNWNDKLLVLSFADTALSSLCSPSLSSVSLNNVNAGKEIATIHSFIKKSNHVAHMHVVMKNHLFARETTQKNDPEGIIFSKQKRFTEEELAKITASSRKCMSLEKLLISCSSTDLKIIHCLVLSKTINEMQSILYLSCESIKYHIKKYKAALGFSTTKELSEWLQQWIDPFKLEEALRNNKTFKNNRY